jgi:hypothetical protein
MSALTVSYERKLSDGNFGSEGLVMSWSWDPEDDEDPKEQLLESAATFLRALVLGVLARSAAPYVARQAGRELQSPSPSPSLEDIPF